MREAAAPKEAEAKKMQKLDASKNLANSLFF